MAPDRKQQVIDLLKSLETKNPAPFAYVDPNKYIQHNLQVGPGPAGVAALIKNLPPDASVNTIRVFKDGDYVFAHTEYNFFGPKVGFDIFRFEDGLIVEHWDNLQETATGRSPSGHTMIDGPTIASDLDKTDSNKALMQRYMDDLLAGRRETFPSYFNGIEYIQHNPWVADTIPGLIAGLQALAAKGRQSSTSECIWYLVKVISSWSLPSLRLVVCLPPSTIYSALKAARSLNTGIRSKRFHLASNGRIATANSSSVRGRTYASGHVWKKIGGAFFSAGVFLTCAWSQGKLSGCVDTYANAERLSWAHSTHSTGKGFFGIRAPAPSRQH
jgi:predicted SnoaL-like aldol condensation-catalyzing enzyme